MTGGKKISKTSIHRLYKKKGIKVKAIVHIKKKAAVAKDSDDVSLKELKTQVDIALKDGREIIFVDECMFTHATMPKKAYAAVGDNVRVNPNFGNTNPVALLAGISADHGIVHFLMFDRSVNTERFLEFLEGIDGSMQGKKVAIFMDNLNVHRSNKVRDYMEENDMMPIFNIPYSPQYNPIEVYFAHIKNHYRKEKLGKMVNNERFDGRNLIIGAIESRSQDSVMKVAASGIEKLRIK